MSEVKLPLIKQMTIVQKCPQRMTDFSRSQVVWFKRLVWTQKSKQHELNRWCNAEWWLQTISWLSMYHQDTQFGKICLNCVPELTCTDQWGNGTDLWRHGGGWGRLGQSRECMATSSLTLRSLQTRTAQRYTDRHTDVDRHWHRHWQT